MEKEAKGKSKYSSDTVLSISMREIDTRFFREQALYV